MTTLFTLCFLCKKFQYYLYNVVLTDHNAFAKKKLREISFEDRKRSVIAFKYPKFNSIESGREVSVSECHVLSLLKTGNEIS